MLHITAAVPNAGAQASCICGASEGGTYKGEDVSRAQGGKGEVMASCCKQAGATLALRRRNTPHHDDKKGKWGRSMWVGGKEMVVVWVVASGERFASCWWECRELGDCEKQRVMMDGDGERERKEKNMVQCGVWRRRGWGRGNRSRGYRTPQNALLRLIAKFSIRIKLLVSIRRLRINRGATLTRPAARRPRPARGRRPRS